MNKKALIGVVTILVGAALISPKETSSILESLSNSSSKNNINKKNNINSVELGLIRRTKNGLFLSIKKFWKWLY